MTVWILGKQYDVKTELGRKAVLDLIDDARDRQAPGDLSMIAYALIGLL